MHVTKCLLSLALSLCSRVLFCMTITHITVVAHYQYHEVAQKAVDALEASGHFANYIDPASGKPVRRGNNNGTNVNVSGACVYEWPPLAPFTHPEHLRFLCSPPVSAAMRN